MTEARQISVVKQRKIARQQKIATNTRGLLKCSRGSFTARTPIRETKPRHKELTGFYNNNRFSSETKFAQETDQEINELYLSLTQDKRLHELTEGHTAIVLLTVAHMKKGNWWTNPAVLLDEFCKLFKAQTYEHNFANEDVFFVLPNIFPKQDATDGIIREKWKTKAKNTIDRLVKRYYDEIERSPTCNQLLRELIRCLSALCVNRSRENTIENIGEKTFGLIGNLANNMVVFAEHVLTDNFC